MGSSLSTKRKRKRQKRENITTTEGPRRNFTNDLTHGMDFTFDPFLTEPRRNFTTNLTHGKDFTFDPFLADPRRNFTTDLTHGKELTYDPLLTQLRSRFLEPREIPTPAATQPQEPLYEDVGDVDSDESSSWISFKEKCYDPQDSTFTFVDEEDVLDFLCEDFQSLRAKMSCGHAVTPTSLTEWCLYLLEKGDTKFKCGACDAEWSFDEVCKMALLTPEEIEYFEEKMFGNAAKDYLNIKACPGCQSLVTRTNLNDLSVQCPVCTAETRRAYRFCWQCMKTWKGPAPRSDCCANDGCQNPVEILKNCPDITFSDVKGVTGCPSIRACPTCGLLVEHNKKKCKGVFCTRCKVKFCFVCLKIFEECADVNNISSLYELCSSGVAPRQTSIPVWQRKS